MLDFLLAFGLAMAIAWFAVRGCIFGAFYLIGLWALHRGTPAARMVVGDDDGSTPAGSSAPRLDLRPEVGVVNLELVLDFLARNEIRATYGAVGAATGIHERSLRHEHQFRNRDSRTAWVVYAGTRQPPSLHARRPNDSELIRDGDDLACRASTRQ